jgi:hypothetical protein
MKSNSYNRVTILALWMMAVGLLVVVETTVGQTQGRRTRDRSTRTNRTTESSTSRTTRPAESSATRATIPAEANGATKTVEPNAAARGTGQVPAPSAPAADAAPADEVSPANSAGARQGGFAAYQIIRQRNIFSRNRVAYRPPSSRETRVIPTPDPETYLVLRGIVQENNEFIAFVEDTRSGQVERKHLNDSVARGTIKGLGFDSIEYQFGDNKPSTVKIGSNLQGGQTAVVVTDETADWPQGTASSGSTTQPAQTGQSSTSSSSLSDIEKRLMEQRRQQLGQ